MPASPMSTAPVPDEARPVLVTGATGKQGGATVRALLAAGAPVRALVRDPSAERAQALRELGVELVAGDLFDRDSVVRAATGARAVFSVQMPAYTPDGFDFAGEITQGANLVDGALAAGVPQFVHTSASRPAPHPQIPGSTESGWAVGSPLHAKAAVEDRVRAAGFPHWTLLRPSTFMENFDPSMAYMFPRGVEGGLVSVLNPGTYVSVVATTDIGAAAAAALLAPERFDGVELELASDFLPMSRIAEVLSDALGVRLPAPDMTVEEALAAGMPQMGASLDWMNVVTQPARPQFATELGIPLTSFERWAHEQLGARA